MAKQQGAVRIMVMAKTGDPLDEVTASVAVVRAGSIRRKPIPKAKETTFFQLTMDVGERPVFVSAPGYYERARRVRFVAGVFDRTHFAVRRAGAGVVLEHDQDGRAHGDALRCARALDHGEGSA